MLFDRTGLYVQIPPGFEIQVRSRSGLAAKESIVVLNSPGTLDSDYRGEIKIILYNSKIMMIENSFYRLNSRPFIIKIGDRIAQIILNPINQINWEVSKKLNESIRNTGGFGSTGIA